MRRWLWANGLALFMFGAFLVFIVAQSVFGWLANNEQLADFQRPAESYLSYLVSGDFFEMTFENWESEFLQMGSYVLLAAFLVQRGSPESNNPDSTPLAEDNPWDPAERKPDSPWPVRHGGMVLVLYQNSLAIALFGMFALSFVLHLLAGAAAYNTEQVLIGKPPVSVAEFLVSPEFWAQSMQNWQSEFLSVGMLIVLSVVLRQRGSSQSKHVARPHRETGT